MRTLRCSGGEHGLGLDVTDACGIYDAYVALCLVRCQACGAEFTVAIERERALLPDIVQPTAIASGSFHFGDPPRHDCVGDTMNSDLVQILEFWSRDNPEHEWRRLPERELAYLDHGSDEALTKSRNEVEE